MNTKQTLQDTLAEIDPQAAEAHRNGALTDSDAHTLICAYQVEKLADLDTRISALEAEATEPGETD